MDFGNIPDSILDRNDLVTNALDEPMTLRQELENLTLNEDIIEAYWKHRTYNGVASFEFFAWTETRVLFIMNGPFGRYLDSVPRHPNKEGIY